jgi:RNA-directed DNA polymerase
MMNGRGESDSAIVAGKPTNKAERSAAEPAEPRAEAKGNAGQQSTRRAQNRVSVSQALERIRQTARQRKKEKFTALSKASYRTRHADTERVKENE